MFSGNKKPAAPTNSDPSKKEIIRLDKLISEGNLNEIKKIPLAELKEKLLWTLNSQGEYWWGTKPAELAAGCGQNHIALYFFDCFPELLQDEIIGIATLLRCIHIDHGGRFYSFVGCNYNLAIELVNRGISPQRIFNFSGDDGRGETLLNIGINNIISRYGERKRFNQYPPRKTSYWVSREKMDDAALVKQLEDDRTRFIEFLIGKKADVNLRGIRDDGYPLWILLEDPIPRWKVDYTEFAFNRNCKLLLDAGADPCVRMMGHDDNTNTPFLAALHSPQTVDSIKLLYAKVCELNPQFSLANIELYSTQLLLNKNLNQKPRVETAIFILENGGKIDLTKQPVGTSIVYLCDYVNESNVPMELINRLAELLIANGENIQPGVEEAEKVIARLTAQLAEEEEEEKNGSRFSLTSVRASFHRRTGLFAPQKPQKKSDPRIERLMNYVQFITETNAKYVTTTYQALQTFSADVSRVVSQYVGHSTRNVRFPT